MRTSKTALATSITIALLWTAAAPAQDRATEDRPVVVGGKPVSEVHGVWRSRGYGYIVRIDGDGPRLFHAAGSFCYADDAGRPPSTGVFARMRAAVVRLRDLAITHILRVKRDPDNLFGYYRGLGPDTVAFSAEPGQTRIVFDRLPNVPPACSDNTPWTAPRMAALVGATFADIYPSFEQRGIDWPPRVAAAVGVLDDKSDDDALFKTLQTMMTGIEDPHVELHAQVADDKAELMPGEGTTLRRVRAAVGDKVMDAQEWLPAYHRGVLDEILQGRGQERANKRLFWGRVGDVGYLNLLSMEGLSTWGLRDDKAVLDNALDEAMTAFQGARAVVVDVTYNLGGYDSVSQYVAGRFAEARKLAYRKVAKGARDVEPQAFYVEPSKRTRYLGPVYLVTSDVTVSAGEIFTLYMRALPNVTHVGGTTRGALSDMIEKPLPNGWSLALAGEIYRDADGQNYEVRGIPPKVAFDVFPSDDLARGHPRRVKALIEEIRQGVPIGSTGGDRPPAAR